MSRYAIVQFLGRQYWFEEKRFYDLDKLNFNPGDTFLLDKILVVKEQNMVKFGTPFLREYKVEAVVIRHLLDSKIHFYKMNAKKKTRKTKGHRKELTRIFITAIIKTNPLTGA